MSDEDDTPVETPLAVLPEHREPIAVLSNAALQLTHAVALLGDIVHELRVARDPIGNATREKLGRFGLAVREVGAGIAAAFPVTK